MKNYKQIIIIAVLLALIVGASVFYYYYRQTNLKPVFEEPVPISQSNEEELDSVKKDSGEEVKIIDGNLDVSLPEGFYINIFSEGMQKPRFMTLSPEGEVWVADLEAGQIIYLPDKDNDGRADEMNVILENLNQPNSLAFYGGYLYIAETNRVVRFAYDGEVHELSREVVVPDLPFGEGHYTRTILFKDNKMYISAGSSCNVCIEDNEKRAAILEYNPDGTGYKVFAKGLRNSVGLAVNPLTDEIWAMDNGRDWLGDNLPPEEINIIKEGGFYGWPYCYGDGVLDPEFGEEEICAASIHPRLKFQAHSAPLGLVFYDGDLFPPEYQNDIFVAYHGSWNRSAPTGYKLVRFDYQNGKYEEKDFLTGFLKEDGSASGRPVDVLVGENGELYISDDKGGRIFRITFINK